MAGGGVGRPGFAPGLPQRLRKAISADQVPIMAGKPAP
jgi:hypothetical protein